MDVSNKDPVVGVFRTILFSKRVCDFDSYA